MIKPQTTQHYQSNENKIFVKLYGNQRKDKHLKSLKKTPKNKTYAQDEMPPFI